MKAPRNIVEYLQSEQIAFDRNVDLKTKTWIKRGGVAHIWVQPTQLSDLKKLVSWCQVNNIQFEVVGNTSNCYFLNEYNPELVISTLKLKRMQVEEDTITCDCGFSMSRLAKHCISRGIAGFEGFIGLPGTAGGAAINNAGCLGSIMSEVVQSVTIIRNGSVDLLTNQQLSYRHRNSALKSKEIEGVVLSITFRIKHKDDPAVLEKRAREYQIHRKTIQEQTYPNLGSTFCTLELKRFPFFSRCINAVANRLLNLIINDPVKKQKCRTRIRLRLLGAGMFRKYVSDSGIGCFVWKDDGADEAFNKYVEFIKRNTVKSAIEIDIKGERAYEYDG